MRPREVPRAAAAALAAAVFIFGACRGPSDESRIREVLSEAVARTEKSDAAGLMEFFAPGYKDFQGRSTAGTLRLVASHLEGTRNIVIHLLGVRIGEIGADGRATVECEVALSHGAAEALRRLIRYTGEIYRFRIDLIRTAPGAWRFAFAEWRSIGLAGLFPESLDLLKELFPRL